MNRTAADIFDTMHQNLDGGSDAEKEMEIAQKALYEDLVAALPEKKNPTPELLKAEGEKAQDYAKALKYHDQVIDEIRTKLAIYFGQEQS